MSEPAAANSASASAASIAAPPLPYRIPIQLLPPQTAIAIAPDFHVCLIDQLINAEQLAERRRIQAVAAQPAPPTSGSICSVTSLAADRPAHDRLPVTIAITSANNDAAAASPSAPVGVQLVTLLQPSEAASWAAARDAREDALERTARTAVRLENVALAHASRCPCRAPLPPESDGSAATAASASAAAEAATSSPATAAPAVSNQLRLAVVVVPSLYSVRHCLRCAPALAPDASPCTRVLATRRPAMMRAFPGCWVFPGGACDPTDPSLEHTGAREVLEETGLAVSPESMKLVALWEAVSAKQCQACGVSSSAMISALTVFPLSPTVQVYPVIRPTTLAAEQRFEPKARYLITMFTAEVQLPSDTPADAASAPSSTALPSRTPTCIGCSVPLRLCSTEVDAAVWLSGAEFDALRLHASYFHTDNEAELQTQHHKPSQHQAHDEPQQLQPQRCLANTDECNCAQLHAMVTPVYAQQHAKHTRLRSDAASSAPAAPSATSAASAPSAFLPAFVPCCALYGLYPNPSGSGMAEGHLVALEEMRARGLF